MGGVFFRRDYKPKAEVINDVNKELITLFRILQRHYPQFMEMLRFQVTSRAEFERLCKVDPDTLTDLERAARFLYLQRTTFGGKVDGQSYGVNVGGNGRFDTTRISHLLHGAHTRLAGVVIEKLGYSEFIQKYDRPETLFYIDPPYWNCEDDYGKDLFDKKDFTCLRDALGKLNGKFIMSLNDLADVREHFAQFEITQVETTYSISSQAQQVSEVLISNCPIDISDKQPTLFQVPS